MENKTLIETLQFHQRANYLECTTEESDFESLSPDTSAFSVVLYFTFYLSEPPSVLLTKIVKERLLSHKPPSMKIAIPYSLSF